MRSVVVRFMQPSLSMSRVSTLLYVAISGALIIMAFALIVMALWNAVSGSLAGNPLDALLDALGLIIIAMAVGDVGKSLYDEEVVRERELGSAIEARQNLTKFMVIICIAVALEGVVNILRAAGEETAVLLSPVLLVLSAAALMIALGIYQKLSGPVESKERNAAAPAGGKPIRQKP
jgi:hypothetical protein